MQIYVYSFNFCILFSKERKFTASVKHIYLSDVAMCFF